MKGRPRPAAFRFGRGALRKIFLPYPRAAVRMRGRVCAKAQETGYMKSLRTGFFRIIWASVKKAGRRVSGGEGSLPGAQARGP